MRSTLILIEMLSICSGLYHPLRTRTPGRVRTDPISPYSKDRELNATLVFGPLDLAEDSNGMGVKLNLVGFNDTSPGPTLRVRAGDTLRILLKNHMKPEQVSTHSVHNDFRQFDTVNLHTHGLHVSPLVPGDDIIDTFVLPGEEFQYVYKIPEDHMGGTFWYHPHYHGATAAHVNDGAAGLFIIEDAANQLPAEVALLEEHVVVAHRINFDDLEFIGKGK